MVQILKAIKSPFAPVRQVWKDYKVGRATRQNNSSKTDAEEPREKRKSQEGNQCQDKAPRAQTYCAREVRRETPDTARGWKYRPEREFPWSFVEIVQEESNWRGTWVLEVKDMQAMNWETERVLKEGSRKAKYLRRPTRHFPFPVEEQCPALLPSEGGQDDLMVWLGRQ